MSTWDWVTLAIIVAVLVAGGIHIELAIRKAERAAQKRRIETVLKMGKKK